MERMRATIESGRYESSLLETGSDARIMGISVTPTFVFDCRLAVSGAQPTEVMIRGFELALCSAPRNPGSATPGTVP